MAFSMVRIASRLTTMNALDRYPVASAQLAANLSFKDRTQLYENVSEFKMIKKINLKIIAWHFLFFVRRIKWNYLLRSMSKKLLNVTQKDNETILHLFLG